MSGRDRTVIAVLCFVAAIAGGWMLVIQPKRNELSRLKRQVSAEQTQLTTAQTQVAQGESARSQFSSNYASMVRLGEAVPTDDNVGSLIYQLQAAATASGVDFRALSLASQGGSSSTSAGQAPLPPGVTIGPAGFPVEPFSFTFQGSFFNLAGFFGRLERFVTSSRGGLDVRGRLLTLDSIDLGPGSGGFPQISATVAATAYLLPSSQGLAAGATPVGPASSIQQASTGSSPDAAGGASSSAPPAAAIAGGPS